MSIEQRQLYQQGEALGAPKSPLKEFSAFVRRDLPQINMRNYFLEAGGSRGELNTNLQQFATRTNHSATRIAQIQNLQGFNLQDALHVHLPLALSLASVARFVSDQDTERMMDTTITVLENLGKRHSVPPWLTAAEYYLHNDPKDPFTFTGHPGEKLFIDIARNATAHFDTAAEKLFSVTKKSKIEPDDTEDLQEASGLLGQGREEFRRFHTDPGWDNRFFYEVLRGFSRPIKLRGKVYPSKSIATNEPQRVVDTLLGLGDHSIIYYEDTKRRLAVGGMAGQNTERLKVVLEMAGDGQTLPRKLAGALDIPEVLLVMSPATTPEEQVRQVKSHQAQLNDYLTEKREELRERIAQNGLDAFCHGYINVVDQNAQASGTHRSLIQRSIINPQESAEKEGRMVTVEQSRYGDEGLGGLLIPEVIRLQILRKNDSLAYILKSIL